MLFESALNQRPLRKTAKAEKPAAPAASAVSKKEVSASDPVSSETESKLISKKD